MGNRQYGLFNQRSEGDESPNTIGRFGVKAKCYLGGLLSGVLASIIASIVFEFILKGKISSFLIGIRTFFIEG